MNLVRICHVVDMPSSGKCDFNYIYVVGLILSILIHFESVLFDSVHIGFLSLRCSSSVHVLVWFWLIVPRMLACVILFLLCVFSVFSQIQGVVWFVGLVFSGNVWFPVLHLALTDDHDVDHPVVVHRECLYRSSYTPTSLFIYFVPTIQYPFIIII